MNKSRFAAFIVFCILSIQGALAHSGLSANLDKKTATIEVSDSVLELDVFDTTAVVNKDGLTPVIPKREYLLAMENDSAIVIKTLLLPKMLYAYSKRVKLSYSYKMLNKMDRNLTLFQSLSLKTSLEGILLCASEKGIWVYVKKQTELHFIPYNCMRTIQMGVRFGQIFKPMVIVGAGIGFLTAIGDADPLDYISYPLAGAAIGTIMLIYPIPLGPIFLIRDLVSKNHYYRFKNKNSGIQFYNRVTNNVRRYGDYIDVKSFKSMKKDNITNDISATVIATSASGSTDNTNTSNSSTINSSNTATGATSAATSTSSTSSTTSVNSGSTTSTTTPNSADANTSTSTTATPKETPQGASMSSISYKRADGKLDLAWMLTNFMASDVDEVKLLKKIPYIRSNNYLKEDLQSLKSSELQFLVFYMITADGYSFDNLNLNFSKSQIKLLKNLELYNNQQLKSTDGIPTSVLSLSDRSNLKVIYELLTGKTP